MTGFCCAFSMKLQLHMCCVHEFGFHERFVETWIMLQLFNASFVHILLKCLCNDDGVSWWCDGPPFPLVGLLLSFSVHNQREGICHTASQSMPLFLAHKCSATTRDSNFIGHIIESALIEFDEPTPLTKSRKQWRNVMSLCHDDSDLRCVSETV